jgi:hypothetical protein
MLECQQADMAMAVMGGVERTTQDADPKAGGADAAANEGRYRQGRT